MRRKEGENTPSEPTQTGSHAREQQMGTEGTAPLEDTGEISLATLDTGETHGSSGVLENPGTSGVVENSEASVEGKAPTSDTGILRQEK